MMEQKPTCAMNAMIHALPNTFGTGVLATVVAVHARADENIHLSPARGKTIKAAVGEGQHVRPFFENSIITRLLLGV